jgi:hypothetical protein
LVKQAAEFEEAPDFWHGCDIQFADDPDSHAFGVVLERHRETARWC